MRDMGKGSVLIVDDDEDVRHAVRLVLYEFDVAEAADATEGCEVASEVDPSFILLDERMPGPVGAEAAENLRSAAPKARVIAFGALIQSRPDWADGFLCKVDLLELPELLRSMS